MVEAVQAIVFDDKFDLRKLHVLLVTRGCVFKLNRDVMAANVYHFASSFDWLPARIVFKRQLNEEIETSKKLCAFCFKLLRNFSLFLLSALAAPIAVSNLL